MKHVLPFILAVAIGGTISYIDSRPNWDDTGLTALVIFSFCFALGFIWPSRPWLWATAVGMWVPLVGITLTANYGALLSFVFAFGGAYAGKFVMRGLRDDLSW